MVNITFIQEDNREIQVNADLGEPLMYEARDAGVDGIVAECGGSAMCATCHCYVVTAPDGALPDPSDAEADTIEFMANEPTNASRLLYQIIATEEMAGAVFRVATGR